MSYETRTTPVTATLQEVKAIVADVRPYSMVPDDGLLFAIRAILDTADRGVSGVIVECGTWLGGSSMAMMLAQKKFLGGVQRPVYMLDSFEGLPAVEPRDGERARLYQERKLDPARYHDNCRANIDDVVEGLAALNLREGEYFLRKGWFEATVPGVAQELKDRRVSVLRLDGDWY